MKKIFLSILAIFVLTAVTTKAADDVSEYIVKADSLDKLFQYEDALKVLEEANQKFPNNWEVLWRMSRENVYIGNFLKDDDAREAQYVKALGYAEQAVKLAPDQSVTYLRRAIANGKIALFKGVFSVGDLVNSVKADLEKAIELGNGGNYVQAIAHYVLGRTHAKVSEKWKPARSVLGLGWADLEIALKEYATAEKLFPGFAMIHLDYAKALMRDDKYKEAKAELEKVLAAKILDKEDPQRKEEAKELLKEVNEELE
jgi:tetratricopeptide (TPR) repeat protein